ncbi:S-layer homology domain-containing protein [Candidatus Gracilibacteria bacterium]|nr:S-layer homology domain-containing protein [Candidatus Gracilibacteria bacterium]
MRIRKILSIASIAALLSTNLMAFAYTDLGGSYAETAVNSLVSQGMLDGSGSFNGGQAGTRAFAVEMVVKGMGLDPVSLPFGEDGLAGYTNVETTFSDVSTAHPSWGYIEAAASVGLVAGDTGSENSDGKKTFRPDAVINRAEVAKIVVGGNNLTVIVGGVAVFDDVKPQQWFYDLVNTAYANSVINGYKNSDGNPSGQYGPGDSVVRQDVAVMVYQAQNPVMRDLAPIAVVGDDMDAPVETVSNGDAVLDSDAAYTGSFPAPEGVVLSGYYGTDEFNSPTGNGKYQFKVQTAWRQSVLCLDSTRFLTYSKGASYEEGFYRGHGDGKVQYNSLVPIYDESPVGSGAGNQYYDEGYRFGYSKGYVDSTYFFDQPSCPGGSPGVDGTVDLSTYDSDGMFKYEMDDFPSLDHVFGPPGQGVGVTYSSQSLLGADSLSMTFSPINYPVHEETVNTGLDPLNIDQIDMLDGELDAAEQAMTTEEFAQAIYDMNLNELQTIAKTCVLYSPLILTSDFGGEAFTQLAYSQQCASNLNQIAYVFKKNDAGNRMLMMYFQNTDMNVSDGNDGFDEAKLMNNDFITQFLEGVKYE